MSDDIKPDFVRGALGDKAAEDRVLRIAQIADPEEFLKEVLALTRPEQILTVVAAQSTPLGQSTVNGFIRVVTREKDTPVVRELLSFLRSRLDPNGSTFDKEWRKTFMIGIYEELIAAYRRRSEEPARLIRLLERERLYE
jgi:hypothetical protein